GDRRGGLERPRRPRCGRRARRAGSRAAARAPGPLRRRAGRRTGGRGAARPALAGGRRVSEPVRVGVAGLGYWGPNLARNFAGIDGCELTWCCDASPASRERWARAFPSARFTAELDDLLADPALDAVVLATPVPT